MKIDILGVLFDNLTMEEAVATGTRLAEEEGFHYVVTPNPEIVNLARASRDYGELLNGADLVLPDGIGILYAGRILNTPLRERVPGIDFAAGLLKELAAREKRLYLLGAKPGVAQEAGVRLAADYPGLMICGTGDGYFTDSEAAVQAMREAEADVAFVCLGAPKQERWMAEFGPQSGVRLMVGLGGALDVFAGRVARAPRIWQRLGLEWLYRLLHQPSRIGRMAKLPLFLVTAWRARRGSSANEKG
ncbi:MAG: N-acetylmannosaminyltransferase [Firmicutes bacterium]|nr:N-acetylmannosaminyltransferase [Bacillota bacterium]